MSNYEEYNSIYAFHPGYYINELAYELNINQAELALRMGVSPKTVSYIINGKSAITCELARKLSLMTGTSMELWTGIQAEYDKKCLEIKHEQELEAQHEILRGVFYKFFVKTVGLPDIRNWKEQIHNLCSYLNISDLRLLASDNLIVNFRKGVKTMSTQNMINANAWVQTVLNIAREETTGKTDLIFLERMLPEIRKMTIMKPIDFMPKLINIFNECKVSFILLPYLKNSCINGAVKWIDHEHAVMGLNDRRSYADTFWFSLFHEIKHILQQKIRKVFVSYENSLEQSNNEGLEIEADDFARNCLIPKRDYEIFLRNSTLSVDNILRFANLQAIHPGIIVGRLQYDKKIKPNQYNQFREKYKII